jgi:ER lumen protein retaining receptor
MKIFYIFVSALTICKIKYLEPIKSVYNANQDSFPHLKCAVLPCFMLGVVITVVKHTSPEYGEDGVTDIAVMECLWTTSLFLESIAILPQLFVLRRYRLVENLTGKFMLCLGSYRVLYMLNWMYRSMTQEWYRHNYTLYITGIIQACMYLDFFIQYVRISAPCCGGGGTRYNENDNDDHEGLIFEISRNQQHHSIGEATSDPLLIEVTEDVTATSSSKDLAAERRSRFTTEAGV